MSRYECTLLYDASSGVNVEAESVEEAIERAYEKAPHVGLCHQCSNELDVGDLIGVIVYHDGKEVADTTYAATQLWLATAERDALRAERDEAAEAAGNTASANLKLLRERDALRAEVERLQRIIDSKPEPIVLRDDVRELLQEWIDDAVKDDDHDLSDQLAVLLGAIYTAPPAAEQLVAQEPICTTCGGTGSIEISGPHWQSEFQPPEYEMGECDICGGSGKAIAEQPDTVPVPRALQADDRVPDDFRNQASGYRAGWNDCLAALLGKESV